MRSANGPDRARRAGEMGGCHAQAASGHVQSGTGPQPHRDRPRRVAPELSNLLRHHRADADRRAQAIIEEAKARATEEGNKIVASARAEAEQQTVQAREALREQVARRFVTGDEPLVAQQLVIEAEIQQVQDRVLDAADVLVDRQPVVRPFVDQVGRARRGVARVVPARLHEGVEGVGLALGRAAALRAGLDRRIGELLDPLEAVGARLALVFVERHKGFRYSMSADGEDASPAPSIACR